MKKFLIAITVLIVSFASQAQQKLMQGSLQKNADPAKVNILFKPNFNSSPGEGIFLLQYTIAIPAAGNGSVTATAVGVTFSSPVAVTPYIETHNNGDPADDEKIFTWMYGVAGAAQSWTAGIPFTGFEVTFSTNLNFEAKLVDFTNIGGGATSHAYFGIASTVWGDITDYNNHFFSIPLHNTLGTYPNGDQFVKSLYLSWTFQISGTVYADFDGNCAFTNAANDKGAFKRMIKVEDINNSLLYYVTTDNLGAYSIKLPLGTTYEVSLVNNSTTTETATCTGTMCNSTTVNGHKVYCVNTSPAILTDFFIQPRCDAKVAVSGNQSTVPFCGSQPSRTPCPTSKWKYCVTFTNTGDIAFKDGTIFELELDPTMSFSGAVPALCGLVGSYNAGSHTFQWTAPNCTDFPPGFSCTVCVDPRVQTARPRVRVPGRSSGPRNCAVVRPRCQRRGCAG